MITDKMLQLHDVLTRKTPTSPPNTSINPADPDNVEALIDDIECMGDFQHESNFAQAAKYLRSFGFAEEAIEGILANASHEIRVQRAYFEAVRVQSQRAIDGLPEAPKATPFEVKTLTFGNPPFNPGDKTLDKATFHFEPKSDVVRTEVSDAEFEDVSFTSNTGLPSESISPVTADEELCTSAEAPIGIAVPPKAASIKVLKAKLPEDVIQIVNAHYPTDRSGTIYQNQLIRWVPDIKTLPKYSAFDLFGELNGEMVDLVFYVNREGSTCYLGNTLRSHRAPFSVKWEKHVLGPLPEKGEHLLIKVISVNPRVSSNCDGLSEEEFDGVHVTLSLPDETPVKIKLLEELFDEATTQLIKSRIWFGGAVCRGRYVLKEKLVKATVLHGKPILLIVKEPTCEALISALLEDDEKIKQLQDAIRALESNNQSS